MTLDFLGRVLKPGDHVIYSRANSGTVGHEKRTIQRIEDGRVYLTPQHFVVGERGYVDNPDKRNGVSCDHNRLIKYIL